MSNPVKSIMIEIGCSGGLPWLASDLSGYAGTQWDSCAQVLKLVRDEEYAGLALLLMFADGEGNAYEENIGVGNEYLLTNALTRTQWLELRVAFIDGGSYRYGLNAIGMKFLPAQQGGEEPEPEPNRLAALEGTALAGFEQSGGIVEFFNIQGQSAGTISAGGGGGGGTSTTAWLPAVSETGDLSWSQSSAASPPETRNIMGPAGADGNDGATGPAGADGYTPVRGVDFWTAADIAAINTSTRDYIDAQLGVIVNGSY